MQRARVSSGTILSIGYEAATSTLELEMAAGEIVQFYNVPLSTYIGLMNAGSKGDYYLHNIKAIYESKQVTEEVISNDNDLSASSNQ